MESDYKRPHSTSTYIILKIFNTNYYPSDVGYFHFCVGGTLLGTFSILVLQVNQLIPQSS